MSIDFIFLLLFIYLFHNAFYYSFRPKKIPVFPLTCRKILGSVGRKYMPKNIRIGRSEILFILLLFFLLLLLLLLVNFLYADFRAKLLLGAHMSTKLL